MTKQERIEKGLCVDCNTPAKDGSRRCWLCGDINLRRTKAAQHKRRSLGMCRFCQRPAIPEQTLCIWHKTRRAEVLPIGAGC